MRLFPTFMFPTSHQIFCQLSLPLARHGLSPAAACLTPLKSQQALLQATEVLPPNYTLGRYSQARTVLRSKILTSPRRSRGVRLSLRGPAPLLGATTPIGLSEKQVVEMPCLDLVLCSPLWVTLLRQGVGLGDPQRSLPTPNSL